MATSSHPAVIVEDEIAIDVNLNGPSSATEQAIDIAADGTGGFVAVWTDLHNVLAARIGPDGALVDAVPQVVATGMLRSHVAVAVDPAEQRFLVVWREVNAGLFGRLMQLDGQPVTGTFPLAEPGRGNYPDIVFDGSQFLVAWSDLRHYVIEDVDTFDRHFVLVNRVSADGTALDGTGRLLWSNDFENGVDSVKPSVAAGGGGFAIAWKDPLGQVLAVRLSADATPLGIGILGGAWEEEVGLAYDASAGKYLAVWSYNETFMFGRSFTPGGAFSPQVTIAAGWLHAISLASSPGGGHQLLSHDTNGATPAGLYVRMLGPDGVPTAAPAQVSTTIFGGDTAIACQANGCLTGWAQWAGSVELYARRTSASGVPLEPAGGVLLTRGARTQESPTVAFDGDNHLLAYLHHSEGASASQGGGMHIRAVRISGAGELVDATPIDIVTTPTLKRELFVAYGGGAYWVFWTEFHTAFGRVFYARVSPDGELLQAPAIFEPTQRHQFKPQAAWDGDEMVVAWYESTSSLPIVRVRRTSQPSGSAATVGNGSRATVACAGSRCLLGWDTNTAIQAAVVEDGAVGPVQAVASCSGPSCNTPDIAAAPSGFLVAWTRYTGTAIDGNDVDARLCAADGTPVGDVFTLAAGAGSQYLPSVTFDGARYFVAWGDAQSSSISIVGTAVTTAGVIADPAGLLLEEGPGQKASVSATAGSAGRILLGYQRFHEEVLYNTWRVHARLLVPDVVPDTTPPVLSLPAPIVAEASSPAGAVVTYTASAVDEIDGELSVDCAPPSGAVFALGATEVVCSATDASGNTATGSFVVTIRDTTAPTLVLPPDPVVEATGPGGAAVTYAVDASDAVSGTTVICAPPSGSLFALGATTVVCTAVDGAGNTTAGTFAVHVVDTTAPVLTVPANLVAEATSAAGAVVSYQASATDVVDGPVTPICAPPSGSTFATGTTTVTCTAIDSHGNIATATFQVQVVVGWSGVLQPLNQDGSSVFKLGRNIPVKFRVATGGGTLVARLYIAPVTGGVVGPEQEVGTFHYSTTSDMYIFNLDSATLAAGTWQLRIDLGDGAVHTVTITIQG